MNNQQLKFEILSRCAAFPNSKIIREIEELTKAIDSGDAVCRSCLTSVCLELARKCASSSRVDHKQQLLQEKDS